jgi:hypothetical protein
LVVVRMEPEWLVQLYLVGDDAERAESMMEKLRGAGSPVAEEDPGVSWRITCAGFESHAEARVMLRMELDRLADDNWREYLTTLG